MHRSATTKRFVRIAAISGALVLGPPAVIASCSGGDSDTTVPDAGVDAPACPPPADDAARCSGDDPTFVFFPSLACDPSMLGDADAPDGGPCSGVTPIDVSFTTAACSAFLKAESDANVSYGAGTRAPVIQEPPDGAALTPDEWSIFAWARGATALRPSPMRRFLDWVEPSAHALAPLNGDGYVLEFSQGCKEILRVMLAETFWVPDAASWARLSATKGPVTIRVLYAKFTNDAITPGTQPLASAPITITMSN